MTDTKRNPSRKISYREQALRLACKTAHIIVCENMKPLKFSTIIRLMDLPISESGTQIAFFECEGLGRPDAFHT